MGLFFLSMILSECSLYVLPLLANKIESTFFLRLSRLNCSLSVSERIETKIENRSPVEMCNTKDKKVDN